MKFIVLLLSALAQGALLTMFGSEADAVLGYPSEGPFTFLGILSGIVLWYVMLFAVLACDAVAYCRKVAYDEDRGDF